ncbi:MFS transporter [Asticcacaulis sp. W401b]|uniref:MFS transporter n=1 Tax=Asticcacaulis sp. W401b TaxID=3388666 RepID=UPI003970F104
MSQNPYVFQPDELPTLPGSPHTPRHDTLRRWGYIPIALIAGIAGTLGNGLVSVHSALLAGAYGMDTAEAGWLIAANMSTAVCANLLLVRARQQFGLMRVIEWLVLAYILAAALHIFVPGFQTALLLRAVCGLSGSALIGLAVYSMLQVVSPPDRPKGLVIAFGITQLGIPLARLVPTDILAWDGGSGLSYIELGLGLLVLCAIHLHPVPPTLHAKAFRKADFLTMAFFMPAIVLICGVLANGRAHWWTDTPWLGWMLVVALPLLMVAIWLEMHRHEPLITIKWIKGSDVVRFALIALMVRVSLAEQTYGAVGLLTVGGLGNDQLHTMFVFVMIAMVCGTATGAFMLKPGRMPLAIGISALLIMTGALMDSHASNLTRPEQLYLSQSLIGFGAALFLGPSMITGFLRMLKHGPEAFITFLVLFGMTQNLGALFGSALLGSFQTLMAHRYRQTLSENLLSTNPLVMQHGDFQAMLTRESNILAFNDVFRLVALIAFIVAVCMIGSALRHFYQTRTPKVSP